MEQNFDVAAPTELDRPLAGAPKGLENLNYSERPGGAQRPSRTPLQEGAARASGWTRISLLGRLSVLAKSRIARLLRISPGFTLRN